MYSHTSELLCLDFCRRSGAVPPLLFATVSTPLVVEAWARALAHHTDRAFARYVCTGLQYGFRIGFAGTVHLKSAKNNLPSALEHPAVVSRYLAKELSLGRMLGPFHHSAPIPPLHINRFGVIPKGHQEGKWRLITDLSFPKGHSVNDGIDPSLCSPKYSTVDEVAQIVAGLGRGSLLAKIDIESAYRLIPVHPEDRHLLAVQWNGQWFVDPMLPFRLRSAPVIFNAVADALAWHLHRSGIPFVRHYLDDFIVVGPPRSPVCGQSMAILDRECRALGVPIAEHKRDGPTTRLTYLGIEIDTEAGQLRLPEDKLRRLGSLLREWTHKKHCRRKELESLLGLLNHACRVVRAGRTFLRRMWDLLRSVQREPNSPIPIRLNAGFRADLAWWNTFVHDWNGVSFLAPPAMLPQVVMTSDASGSWGCGAWHGNAWFQLQWDQRSQSLSIAEKELLPILLVCLAWGQNWAGHRVVCRCDNQVVVACIRSRTSRNKGLMHMLRSLMFIEATLGFTITATYISTTANHLADDLSRNNLASFLLKVPTADGEPTPISLDLQELLLDQQADWSSPTWRPRFTAIFRAA